MDIKLNFNKSDLTFDLGFLNNDLESDEGLQTAVIVSLFSDRLVENDELPFGETGRRGWWGDAIDPTSEDLIGSKLWLLTREKQTDATLVRAEEYARDALQWLLDDGVASAVDIRTSYPKDENLFLEVDISRPGKSVVSYAYNLIWEGQANAI